MKKPEYEQLAISFAKRANKNKIETRKILTSIGSTQWLATAVKREGQNNTSLQNIVSDKIEMNWETLKENGFSLNDLTEFLDAVYELEF